MKQFHIFYAEGYSDADPADTMWLGEEFFTEDNGFDEEDIYYIKQLPAMDARTIWEMSAVAVVVRVA